jgi:hypothetical protein
MNEQCGKQELTASRSSRFSILGGVETSRFAFLACAVAAGEQVAVGTGGGTETAG